MSEPATAEMPSVSVIIVNYNGKEYLETCLRSLQALDYPAGKLEVIVVDNSSTDGSIEYIQANFPEVVISLPDGNYGF